MTPIRAPAIAARVTPSPRRPEHSIVHGKRRITANTALQLARYFGATDRFWPNLLARRALEQHPSAHSAHRPPCT